MITFQSKYYDTESGLYYYYHRYYDPKSGRFITEDPIGIAGGLNLYRFVNNNPVNYVDPRGLWCIPWFSKERNAIFLPDNNESINYEINFIIIDNVVFCNIVRLQKGTKIREIQQRWLCFDNNCGVYQFFFIYGKWNEESLRWTKRDRITVKGFGWANPNDPTKIGNACCKNPWTGGTVCKEIK